jgi:hypothetical protein
MANTFKERVRNLTTQTRWLIAIAAAFVLLLVSAGCSMAGLLMMAFSTDACSSMPNWMGAYLFLPPAVMALGSILAPVLFGLRRRLPWVLGTLIGGWGLSVALYIGWVALIATQC